MPTEGLSVVQPTQYRPAGSAPLIRSRVLSEADQVSTRVDPDVLTPLETLPLQVGRSYRKTNSALLAADCELMQWLAVM